MKIHERSFIRLTAIAVLALLLAIVAVPAFSLGGSCAGADDYGLCIASVSSASGGIQNPGDGPAGLGTDHPWCDNDPATAPPPCQWSQ
ncbi:MAG: hypothetical protein F4X02_06625 [Chloroflexi bacterium]|nr:hypothetical protein [Chloroflexota bacterium]